MPDRRCGNWPLWLGLALYAMGFFLYAAALVSLRLNVAYPVLVSGSVVAVALLSLLLFKEPFYGTTVAGIVLVVAGVVLIALRTGVSDRYRRQSVTPFGVDLRSSRAGTSATNPPAPFKRGFTKSQPPLR